MKAMNGHIIDGTSICVDYWMWTPHEKYFHFLSHLHADHTVNLKSSFNRYIYTSPFNGWLVQRWYKISPELVVTLTVGESHVLYDESSQSHFSITLLDANHCPGSVMFLFQGNFGNILYTGDFRYNPIVLKQPLLKAVIENDSVSRLYLDNTFAAEHCEFPPRQQVLQEVLNLIRRHPEHHIVIGIRKLGKEEVLREIALDLKEKVLVTKDRLKILSYLQYENVFTTDPDESRIYVMEIHQINSVFIHRLQEEKGPVLTILLTALYNVNPPGFDTSELKRTLIGVHFLPYSDHSCHSELVEFVSKVKPHKIYPIVRTKIEDDVRCEHPESANISNALIQKHSWNNSLIPQSIINLCKSPSLGLDDFPRVIPPFGVEDLQCGEIIPNLLTDDESNSSRQLPDLVSQEEKCITLQDECSHSTFDIQMLDSRTARLRQPNISMACHMPQPLEDEYTPISDDELMPEINVVPQPLEDEYTPISDDELMPEINVVPQPLEDEYTPISDDELMPEINVVAEVNSRRNNETHLLDKTDQKDASIAKSGCQENYSPPQSKNKICSQDSSESKTSQYYTSPASTPEKTNFPKSIKVQNNATLNKPLSPGKNLENNQDVENEFNENNEMKTSIPDITNYEHFKSSLQPKPTVASTPYPRNVPQKSEISKTVLSIPLFINDPLVSEENLNCQSKTQDTENKSQKHISAEHHSELVSKCDISDSSSISELEGQNKFHLKNIQKSLNITDKFSDLLGNLCECNSDSECFCKAVSSGKLRKRLSQTGKESKTLLHNIQSNPINHCVPKNSTNNCFYSSEDSFYFDICKNNTLELWKRSVAGKKDSSQIKKVANKHNWDDYDWPAIFGDKL